MISLCLFGLAGVVSLLYLALIFQYKHFNESYEPWNEEEKSCHTPSY